MKRVAIWILALAALVSAAHGQAVREPLGASGEPKMIPQERAVTEQLRAPASPIPRDGIRLNNISNKDLDIAYWNGAGEWKTVTVRSSATLDVPCPKCVDFVVLYFPSGKQRNPLKAAMGAVYTLYWSTETQAWDIFSSAGKLVEVSP